MRLLLLYLLAPFVLLSQSDQQFDLEGLEQPVEILTDVWGVPHIYAETENDLFFAQGFYAARDRLFQFEIWRRQATGTVAEILGERELDRDIGTRLFMFRGDMETEMQHYHPRGYGIITSYVRGVNAYIDYVLAHPDQLPLEFRLLGIKPGRWTTEVVVSRHQGLLGNIGQELQVGRQVAAMGDELVKKLSYFHPGDPDLEIDPMIKPEWLSHDILGLYNAFRRSIQFRPDDMVGYAPDPVGAFEHLAGYNEDPSKRDQLELGSNNWVVDGRYTQSGYPVMANDPHRRQSVPSLRYMAHLVGPGWNVTGGGEPEIPGISIGHNEYGAWGLTVYRTDAEDLCVYKINPEDPNQYWYRNGWENMKLIRETIPVKGMEPVTVTLRYTRHGPVVYDIPDAHVAFAVRCGWLEPGGSPYLASLRMDQAHNWSEFREACNYSNIPGENMIWADRDGNIGWQAVGIAPVRRNFSGLVPVPGDGSHEWDGYLPIKAKPHVFNPDNGLFITANEHVTPNDYPLMDAIGYSWSDPFRGDRIHELITSGRKHTLMDMARIQTDYLSIPARMLVPFLKEIEFDDEGLRDVRDYLLDWDYQLVKTSAAAGIYVEWERQIQGGVYSLAVPEEHHDVFRNLQMSRILEWIVFPDAKFGTRPVEGRDNFLAECLDRAVAALEERFGEDMDSWVYGQENYKHILLRHPLSAAVTDDVRRKLEVGPVPRGGNSYTVNQTGGGNNQTSGASFRIICDTGNWDHCLAMNNPGQHGNPDHPHYKNLFEIWAKDQFFPLLYSREKIEEATSYRTMLMPE